MTESNKGPRCPVCGSTARREQNAVSPFCSKRCRTIDFGSWIDERYRLPAEDSDRAIFPDDSAETLH